MNNTIEIRAFNIIEGAVILPTAISPTQLRSGRAMVATDVYRDADREVVSVVFRPLEVDLDDYGNVEGSVGLVQAAFDYCETVELAGLVVNPTDHDDDDAGVS